MTNWLVRFDGSLVAHDELARLSHRCRVAWAYYGVKAIAEKISSYFIEKSGLGLALLGAEAFIRYNMIEYTRLSSAYALLQANRAILQGEGYDIQEFVMIDHLIGSVVPDIAEIGASTDVIHTECGPHCLDSVACCESIQSSSGVVYVSVAQWVHSIGCCDVPIDLLDDLQADFFCFSRRIYEAIAGLSYDQLLHDFSPPIDLPWQIPDAVKAQMLETRKWLPPQHEGSK